MNGIVYGIKDLSSDEIIYIGSTIMNLHSRKTAHKRDCFINQKDRLIYNYIRERTDREHFDEYFKFEELYSGEFETRQELRIKEQEFIKVKAPRCNQLKAFQSNEELKEYMRKYLREYHKTEKWREYKRKYDMTYNREYNKTEKQREYKREYLREWRRRKKLAQNSEKVYKK